MNPSSASTGVNVITGFVLNTTITRDQLAAGMLDLLESRLIRGNSETSIAVATLDFTIRMVFSSEADFSNWVLSERKLSQTAVHSLRSSLDLNIQRLEDHRNVLEVVTRRQPAWKLTLGGLSDNGVLPAGSRVSYPVRVGDAGNYVEIQFRVKVCATYLGQ